MRDSRLRLGGVALFPPLFWEGLVYTCLLSCLTIGFTLVLMTTKVWNMAYGSFATFGAFISLIACEIWKLPTYSTLWLSFFLPAIISLTFYYAFVKPSLARGVSELMLFILTFAFNFILLGLLNILADYLTRVYMLRARLFYLRKYDISILGLPGVTVISPILTAVTIITLHLFLTKTKFGTAMRATIENPALASTLGVNVNLVYSVSWFLSGGLAGIAGGLLPFWILCHPSIGDLLLLSVFAASMVGGTSSIYGAVLGGVTTGLAEVWGTYFLSSIFGAFMIAYRLVVPLVILTICLLIFPQGLIGINWKRAWSTIKTFLVALKKYNKPGETRKCTPQN